MFKSILFVFKKNPFYSKINTIISEEIFALQIQSKFIKNCIIYFLMAMQWENLFKEQVVVLSWEPF
jgi:hypothetical protein